MYSFNIILTTMCNANCSHCYMKTNESARTLSYEEIDLLVSKLPENTKTIVLTGGEIFLAKDELKYIINKINEKFEKVQIGLESNGIYLYNHDALSILKELKNFNVNFIRFSDDPFHEAGGVDLKKVRNLKFLESEETPIIKYLVQTKALSLGKAEKLKEEAKSKPSCMNNASSEFKPYIFMDIDGDMYLCAWKSGLCVGNIFKDEFKSIEDNLKNPINHCVLVGNILDAVCFKTKASKEITKKEIESHGECNICINSFINKGR